MSFKVIVAGGRDFADYELLTKQLTHLLSQKSGVEIVSGCQRGADTMGEEFAKANGYPVKRFPADWTTHGKAAGPIRNEEMAKYADACICFWDGVSRGTKSMISLARNNGLPIRIIHYSNNHKLKDGNISDS